MPCPFVEVCPKTNAPPKVPEPTSITLHLELSVSTPANHGPSGWAAQLRPQHVPPSVTAFTNINTDEFFWSGVLGDGRVNRATILAVIKALRHVKNTTTDIFHMQPDRLKLVFVLHGETVDENTTEVSSRARFDDISRSHTFTLLRRSAYPRWSPPSLTSSRELGGVAELIQLLRNLVGRFGHVRFIRAETPPPQTMREANRVRLQARRRQLSSQIRHVPVLSPGYLLPVSPNLVHVRINDSYSTIASHDAFSRSSDGRVYVDLKLVARGIDDEDRQDADTQPDVTHRASAGTDDVALDLLEYISDDYDIETVDLGVGRKGTVVGSVELDLAVEWPSGTKRQRVVATVVDRLQIPLHVSTLGRHAQLAPDGGEDFPKMSTLFARGSVPAYYRDHPFWMRENGCEMTWVDAHARARRPH